MNNMFNVYVEYDSEIYDREEFYKCIEDLKELNINISVHDCVIPGMAVCRCGDFHNDITLTVLFEFVKTIVCSGIYDIFKMKISKLWKAMYKSADEYQSPFTINIENIPTKNGNKNVCCKIKGDISDEQKSDAINKTFALAEKIVANEYLLGKGYRTYSDADYHVFRYYSDEGNIYEMTEEEFFGGKREDLL